MGYAAVRGRLRGRLLPAKESTAHKAMRVGWSVEFGCARCVLAGPRASVGMPADREVEQALASADGGGKGARPLVGEFDEEDKAASSIGLERLRHAIDGNYFGVSPISSVDVRQPVIRRHVGSTPYVIPERAVDGLLVNSAGPAQTSAKPEIAEDPRGARRDRGRLYPTTSEFTWAGSSRSRLVPRSWARRAPPVSANAGRASRP